jgi:hypothetical protein
MRLAPGFALLPSGGRVIGPILVNHEQATQGRSGTLLLPSGDDNAAHQTRQPVECLPLLPQVLVHNSALKR